MNNTKVILIGKDTTNIKEVAELLAYSEGFGTCKKFSSDPSADTNDFIYLDNLQVNNSYMNNAFVYVKMYDQGIFEGITKHELYNNDMALINMEDFLSISEAVMSEYKILVVFVQSSNDTRYSTKILELFYEKTNRVDTITLLDEELIPSVWKIKHYLSLDKEEQKKFIQSLSVS